MPIIIAIIIVVLILIFIPWWLILTPLVELIEILTSPIFWTLMLVILVLWGTVHGIAHMFKDPEKEKKKNAAEAKAKKEENNRKRRLLQVECGRHTARMVLKHLDSIKTPDEKFWAYWGSFKDDGKWKGELTRGDFAALTTAISVEEPPAQDNSEQNKVDEPKTDNEKQRRLLQVECAQHNATKVLKYLHSLQEPDERYYAYQSCFQEGKWKGILKESDFQIDNVLPQTQDKETEIEENKETIVDNNAFRDSNAFRPGSKVRIYGGYWNGQEGAVRGTHFDKVIVALKHSGQTHEESIPVANCQLVQKTKVYRNDDVT